MFWYPDHTKYEYEKSIAYLNIKNNYYVIQDLYGGTQWQVKLGYILFIPIIDNICNASLTTYSISSFL